MPKRIPFEENWVYHIFNRWFFKQNIFFNKKDYERFFLKLQDCINDFPEINLISYCILPNHFHFIVLNKKEWLFISKFMNKIQVSYWNYIKTKYLDNLEKWQVFEWRFKAKQITSDEYFNKCLYYVNYNAVKHWIVEKIEDYPYTSAHQFINSLGTSKTRRSRDLLLSWVPGSMVKLNYWFENWLEEFFEDFWEFEF
jgi:putative transposase